MTLEELKTVMSVTMNPSKIYELMEFMGDTILAEVSPPVKYKYNHKTDKDKIFVFICDAEQFIPDEINCVYSISRGKGIHLYDLLSGKHNWKTSVQVCHTLIVMEGVGDK